MLPPACLLQPRPSFTAACRRGEWGRMPRHLTVLEPQGVGEVAKTWSSVVQGPGFEYTSPRVGRVVLDMSLSFSEPQRLPIYLHCPQIKGNA